jgi:hypothetical protein
MFVYNSRMGILPPRQKTAPLVLRDVEFVFLDEADGLLAAAEAAPEQASGEINSELLNIPSLLGYRP